MGVSFLMLRWCQKTTGMIMQANRNLVHWIYINFKPAEVSKMYIWHNRFRWYNPFINKPLQLATKARNCPQMLEGPLVHFRWKNSRYKDNSSNAVTDTVKQQIFDHFLTTVVLSSLYFSVQAFKFLVLVTTRIQKRLQFIHWLLAGKCNLQC